MPRANVRGVSINYETLGDRGPWVALNPGGRRALDGVLPIAEKIAAAGYRVLVHDRRNCGASDVVIDGDDSEYEIWADDLHALLGQLDALPVYAGGSSSGCRTSLLLALRHPEAVRGLLLWRVTGGAFAANRLAQNYYGDFMEAAEQGGMAAVCATEFFQERIAANPANRERLMAMDVKRFMEVMGRWREAFLQSADLPVIGATEEQLRSITVPAIVVPGNDRTHGRATGENAARLLPNSELYILFPEQLDVDLAVESWEDQAKQDELAAVFVNFLNRISQPAPQAR
ncbi:MAG TPA: alpha/beta hydrolase [Chloroflexota bacterium]|nr:alpha/beta hydrolase [Chloroflexota bacterium]